MNNHRTNLIGDYGISKVISELIKRGYYVYVPVNSSPPNDLLIDTGKRTYSVEVKTRNLHARGFYEVPLIPSGSGSVKRKDNPLRLECDILAIYLNDIDTVIFIPKDIFSGKTSMVFRNSFTKNGNGKKINYVSDYLDLHLE